MMLHRRHVLASALALPAIGTRAAEPKVLRVGFQKGEPTQMSAKENQDLERLLAPSGRDVKWIEFQFGPPLLEAMRVGSIDLGAVGDTPPVFAQAAHACTSRPCAPGLRRSCCPPAPRSKRWRI